MNTRQAAAQFWFEARKPNKALLQTGLSLVYGSLWRPQLNADTLPD